ncbi:outer membrane lipoprotein carrier protein LolA [Gilvimarinus sp. DA14]|uniref:outer membrane lipoprotein carrier protein LolA n=1 Tax=Gilvimarinus sp. DA14 TaxID=2956798 RepID=UPI0020B8466A|nr:outer membrane lipoprotein carrier protein LolA [Gilvimarinus sp. DA14]UTF59731.1 outer membrane lipoprotein carrier protein LolA [Gilvimarinus sp. DA14]
MRLNVKSASVCRLLLLVVALTVPLSQAQGILEHPVKTTAQVERLDTIAETMRRELPVQAKLVQEKHLSVLAEPLVSEGEFSLAQNGDIVWQINQPFAVRYQVRGDDITRTVDGEVETITPGNEPSVYGFFRMFEQLFALNAKSLQEYFTVYLAPAKSQEVFDLALVPKGAPLDEVVATLLLSGRGGRIDSVTITEPGADYSVLNFRYSDAPDQEPR